MVGSIIEGLGAPIHWASQGLLILLQYDASVFVLCLFGAVWCGRFIRRNKIAHFDEAMSGLLSREEALSNIAAAKDPVEAQARFSQDFDAIADVMARQDRKELALAWEQFRETFIDENEATIRTTARAESYFLHLADDTRVLACSNRARKTSPALRRKAGRSPTRGHQTAPRHRAIRKRRARPR
jgi:hypothetical protein